jgi:transposase InsO family protein
MAAVVDLFSRRVVDWSMSAAMTAHLVTDTLVMAIWRQGKPDFAAASHRSRQPTRHPAVPTTDGRSRRRLLDEGNPRASELSKSNPGGRVGSRLLAAKLILERQVDGLLSKK